MMFELKFGAFQAVALSIFSVIQTFAFFVVLLPIHMFLLLLFASLFKGTKLDKDHVNALMDALQPHSQLQALTLHGT
jgi:hypothetical protein